MPTIRPNVKQGATKDNGMGVDFGRGTKKMSGKPHTSLFEDDAPNLDKSGGSGEGIITDKVAVKK